MIFFVSLQRNKYTFKQMSATNEYRQELKAKIIEYAMDQFYMRGLRAVKMDEISRGLRVSKRTVYEIFGDKEELLLEGLRKKNEEMHQRMEYFIKTEAHNVIDVLSFFYRLQMEYNQKVSVDFYEEIHRLPHVLEFLKKEHQMECEERQRFFKVGVQEGLFRSDVDYDMLAEVAGMGMKELMRCEGYKKYNMQMIFDNYVMVVIRGFCTERGLSMLNKAIG